MKPQVEKPYNRIADYLGFALIVGLIGFAFVFYFWFTHKLEQVAAQTLKPGLQNDSASGAEPKSKASLSYALREVVGSSAQSSFPDLHQMPTAQGKKTIQAKSLDNLSDSGIDSIQSTSRKFRAAKSPLLFLQGLEKTDRATLIRLLQTEIALIDPSGSDYKAQQLAISYSLKRNDLGEYTRPVLKQMIADLAKLSPSEQRNNTLVLATHVYVSLSENPIALKGELTDILRDEHDMAVLKSINKQFGFMFPTSDLPFVVPTDD